MKETALPIITGQVDHLPSVMQLIHDLAHFEQAPQEVANDLSRLREDFEAHQAFAFLVALDGPEVVGFSLYYPRYSTWKGRCYYLEDLYVKPAYRGKGLGKRLLEATAHEARQAGAQRLDWQVLDWNEEAVRFYERIGATVEKEWWNCKWWLS